MGTSRGRWRMVGAWTLIYGANLILPLLYIFATGVVADEGVFGIGLAVALVWLMGLGVCLSMPTVGESLLWGGGFCALAPLVPILLGLSVWLAVTVAYLVTGVEGLPIFHDDRTQRLAYEIVAFGITAMTTYPMLILALGAGYVIRWLRGPRAADAFDPDPDQPGLSDHGPV